MKKKSLSAANLRVILIVIVILMFALAAIGFTLAKKTIQDYAVTVSHAIADENASADNVQTLQTIQKELTEQQSAVIKASEIASPLASYQNQVVTDIDTYAVLAGVTVTVTIASPISYSSLLTFIKGIENNLPKMQLSSINVSRAPSTTDDNLVSTDTLTIQVFTD